MKLFTFTTVRPLTFAISIVLCSNPLLSFYAHADNAPIGNTKDNIEVITITNQRHNSFMDNDLVDNQNFAQGKTSEVDLANWLTSVPGANINSNGPVTGITQYRGLYGDRVAVSLDGSPVLVLALIRWTRR